MPWYTSHRCAHKCFLFLSVKAAYIDIDYDTVLIMQVEIYHTQLQVRKLVVLTEV